MPARRLIFFLLLSIPAWCSSAQDASTTLHAVLNNYASLSTYYVEGTRESKITDEIQRTWEQERFVVAKMPGKRYHYDIKAPDQWNIVVANGMTEWTFQPWRNEYTRRAIPELTAKANGPDDVIRAFVARSAQNYVEDLAREGIQTAEFLPDETIMLAGHHVPCYVIRATYSSPEDVPATKYPAKATFWIEKDRRVVRRETVSVRDSASPLQPLHEIDRVTTTYYETVDLGGSVSDALFNFAPPAGAKLARRLFLDNSAVDLTGFPAPSLRLKTFDGKPFDASSLKGHVVLIDFWASWCVPCVQQIRSLATIADEYKEGLTVVGINWNDDPNAALEFVRKNKYKWTNLRDINGETAKSWMLNGVPLLAIIDPSGTIAYYHVGYEQPEETAIAEVLRKINLPIGHLATPCQTAVDTPSR